ncbi:hypothetical protein KDK95_06825 [Actinospica sp. MGRD01-02]|uniref:Galactosyltransferase C-terminal domain-containing protein n=1 Tax=Actinospica acidithermotolerans TaxID=2828514 RepID=A0A941E8N4_9ACTN|nr:galactosyltransferase-related protein [Actinospica acidithermotolerans]MBR7826013.1 hypothetical protein [Actinospica acidithermotolerans]
MLIPERAADAVVLLADPDAQAANPYYWYRSRPAWEAVAEALLRAPERRVAEAARSVRLDPADLACHARLTAAVRAHLGSDHGKSSDAIREAVERVHVEARLGYHRGSELPRRVRLTDRPPPRVPAERRAVPDRPHVNVVIPFRDDCRDRGRLKNALACLAALADQSLDARRYSVTVVESDVEPRWRESIEPHVDEYLFAWHDGPFNKAWTVNIGAMRTVHPAPLICVLDADALVDREFLARNLARFDEPGVGSLTPLRSVLYLDAESSAWALGRRCVDGSRSVPIEGTRGFLVYRSPGVCVWIRRGVFESIHGLDERYEGWGGEDMELLLRLTARSAFHQFDDPQLHLHHRVEAGILDDYGNTPNCGLTALTWEPTEPVGAPDRYAARQERLRRKG